MCRLFAVVSPPDYIVPGLDVVRNQHGVDDLHIICDAETTSCVRTRCVGAMLVEYTQLAAWPSLDKETRTGPPYP